MYQQSLNFPKSHFFGDYSLNLCIIGGSDGALATYVVL
jgi:hypothetical protein